MPMRVDEYGFPRITVLGFSVNRGNKAPPRVGTSPFKMHRGVLDGIIPAEWDKGKEKNKWTLRKHGPSHSSC